MFFAALMLILLLSALGLGFLTGYLPSFYTAYPIPTVLAVGGILVLAAYLYGNVRPGFIGRLIGYQLLYGFTEQNVYKRFDGIMVDVSAFIHENALQQFREIALEDLEENLKSEVSEEVRRELEGTREKLLKINGEELRRKIHIYGCRRDFTKHLWIVLGEKSIEEYSVPSHRVSFTFPFGFLRRNAAFGVRYDLKGLYKVHPYGKCKVHIFIPILEPGSMEFKAAVNSLGEDERNVLAALGGAITSALKLQSENKALKKEVQAMRKRHDQMTRELSRMAKMLDAARTAARSKVLMPPTEEEARLLGMRSQPQTMFEAIIIIILMQLAFSLLLPKLLGLDPVLCSLLGSVVGIAIYMFWRGRSG